MKASPDAVTDLARRLMPLGRGVVFPRHQLRAFYDSWLIARGVSDGPANFVHAVIQAADLTSAQPTPPPPNPARDGDALVLALAALGAPGLAVECFGAAVAAGLFDVKGSATDIGKARGALTKRAADLLGDNTARAVLQASDLQALVDPGAFWTDPGNLLPAVLLGRRRMCRIETVDANLKPKTGSGFLIGPSAVLTNFHVVNDLPDKITKKNQLRVRFDYSDTTGLKDAAGSTFDVLSDWCMAKSDTGSVDVDGDFWWHDTAKRDGWLAANAGNLDYAVIRLDGAPGLQRGWYNHDDPPTAVPGGLIVLHHPGTEGHTATLGGVILTAEGDNRIFHRAATANGSSGGLALNEMGQPTGLHYLGISTDAAIPAGKKFLTAINVAISLRAIAEDLKQKNLLATIAAAPGISPYRGCIDGHRPVFGRADLMKGLERVWRGQPQMMAVHVEAINPALNRPGKSFTIDIVQGLFRPPEHHHIIFRAGDIKVDAYRMACDTVATFAPDLVDTLPKAPDTTTPAYVRKLVTALGHAIRDRLNNRLVWIMLDDLDRHDLSDASGREFLATLYNQIDQLPNLRIILIGLQPNMPISGLVETKVLRSFISTADMTDFKSQFTVWLKARGARDLAIDDTSFTLIEEIIASYAGTDEPLQRMAQFVTDHVANAADLLLGPALPQQVGGGG